MKKALLFLIAIMMLSLSIANPLMAQSDDEECPCPLADDGSCPCEEPSE